MHGFLVSVDRQPLADEEVRRLEVIARRFAQAGRSVSGSSDDIEIRVHTGQLENGHASVIQWGGRHEPGAGAGLVGDAVAAESDRLGAAQYNGVFARWSFDTKTVTCENDPLGMQSLYITETQDRWFVSTASTVLAALGERALDVRGCGILLLTGEQFGPATLWSGVRRLEPGTRLTFDGRVSSERRYWRPHYVEAPDGSLGGVADHWLTTATRVIADHVRDEVPMCDLTGGFDSRVGLLLLQRAGYAPSAQVSGNPDDVDVRLSRRVAERARADWAMFTPQASRSITFDDHVSLSAMCDGQVSTSSFADVVQFSTWRRRFGDVVVTGGGGEHLGFYPWLTEYLRAGRRRDVDLGAFLDSRVFATSWGSPTSPSVREAAYQYAAEAFRSVFQEYESRWNTRKLDVAYAYKSTGHFGAWTVAVRNVVPSALPFVDTRLFQITFSADPGHRNGHRLHRRVLTDMNSAVAAVDVERGGPGGVITPRNVVRMTPYAVGLARKGLERVVSRRRPVGARLVSHDDSVSTREDVSLPPSVQELLSEPGGGHDPLARSLAANVALVAKLSQPSAIS